MDLLTSNARIAMRPLLAKREPLKTAEGKKEAVLPAFW